MAADIEIKKINQYVQELVAVTSITGSYVYGIDSNGNSIKIAVETLASAGTDYSRQIAELNTKCNNNTTLISQLQTALSGKAAAAHTHPISNVINLQTALDGKAAAAHTHVIGDVAELQTALNGKAAAQHTHTIANVVNLQSALDGKSNIGHTHAIADVEGLQNSLANINSRINEIDGGGVGNALRQEDLNTYTDAKSGDVIQNLGDDTAALQKYFVYECTEGSTVKTITSGTRCLRLTQGASEFISDQEVDVSSTKFIMYYRPTVDGVTYNVFMSATLGDTERAKLVGTYVVTDGGETFQITDVTASGNNITAITLDNGVTLPIDAQTPTRSTQALLTFYSQNGVEYYGTVGDCTLCSKDIVSNVAGTQSYLIATAPIGTLFGAQTDIFTASEDIVFKSVTWTQRNVQPPTSVASGDNFLTITNDELGASIDIAYNSSNQHLELKGKNSAVVSYVDMGVFIKDGMLDDALLYTTAEQGVTVEAPYLKFIFNVASGKSVIRVSLKDLVDIYDGANINLTSAFVKAATYSAPAIGDSMDVAIGKLLKGHEDNAAAIATKQDTLTFDSTPTASSNNPVTSGGIKAAIDSAIGGVPNALKQVDLTTYQGTDGEIVQHTGATTEDYVNGWNYKFTAGQSTSTAACGTLPNTYDASVIPNDYTTKINSLIYAAKPVMMDSIGVSVALYTSNDVYKDVLKDGQYSVGDRYGNDLRAGNIISSNETDTKITISVPNMCGSTAEVEFLKSTLQTFPLFRERKTNLLFALVPKGGDEYKIVGFDEDYRQQYTWQSANDVTFTESSAQGGWQQWNSQPSSVADVSALQQRMTAAETAISGKQPTITGAASTITTANLTASKVLGSDANGKVAATSIATADAEDAVAKRHTQNTDTKIVNGNNKVEVSASGTAITGNGSVSGNFSISGNLNVTGKETVEEIVNIKSENNFITLRDGAQTAIASGSLSGTKVENYDGLGNDLLFGTDGSGTFRIGDEGGTLEPIATRDEAANLTDGQAMVWDATNQRLVGKTIDITPTTSSTDLVTSGGVKTAIDTAPRFYLGTCSTAGNVAIKQVDIPNFPTQLVNGVETPIVGSVIAVKFSNTDEATSTQKKIKVNNTSAYPVWYSNTELTGTSAHWAGFGSANTYLYFAFSGTHWVWVSHGLDFDTRTPPDIGFGYTSCTTAAATAAKTATLSNYNLINGGLVVVYFQYDVPAQATLNINSRGAKEIHFQGSRIAAGVIKAGDKCLFVYNGNYMLIAIDRWGKELQEKVSGINISETDFEALSTYEQGKLYFVYDNNS